ncbi:50S ribosomal protein L11 methyltransferase [Nitrosovibrio sp. Nv4]|uniref:50S ribosomal protein L11 methyltransferase n=1 Tax=Nitrosovibrio sp. Nv4 TaxID=1945880 RepID=UPI000BC3F67D|nr:50S ribosomal protein L11 methyltransferase [Nitrosovibrio sp. Nv4]SOD40292.1 [LSU ribosomal protein L11P]-lysine N-methyltransferase [Nitrosovibrio sp. Nv4]
MSWVSLSIQTDNTHAEVLSDAMLELGALSTDIHDAATGTDEEQFLFDEPGESSGGIWSASELTALFNTDVHIPSIVEAAAQAAQLPSPPSYSVTYVEEQDWVRITQSQFRPIQISDRLWIVPSWHQAPDPDGVNLILDPGLAFGTGSHPSTQLCLAWLDENLFGGEDVLDYGCGSGILAIAALKLGARHVVGIDIDPQAVAASRQNATLNQCNETMAEFFTTHVVTRKGAQNEAADVVIANILANPLIVLAPILMSATRFGGRIVLSGILMEQAEDVVNIYRRWFDMHIAREQAGWALLTGTRR